MSNPPALSASIELPSQRRAVTWRAVLIGAIASAMVSALVPLNDFVFSDTSLAAGFFPLAAVLAEFFLVVLVNLPLRRFAPRHALTTPELSVIVLMLLVACSLPNWGLMRFLVPTPVGPFFYGASDQGFWDNFRKLNLPGWLFPVASVERGTTDPNVAMFYQGRLGGQAVPWSAWALPALAWGTFAVALVATLVALARLVVPQWQQNERLPFPLVQLQVALLEEPKPGRLLNDLFRSPALWIGLGAVMFVHALTILNAYHPRNFPAVPLGYNFEKLLSEGPLFYLRPKVKIATLSLTVVGITYFIRSRAAFSLWGAFILVNLVDVQQGVAGAAIGDPAWRDMHLGACVAFVVGIFFIGRHHWARVIRNAIGRGDGNQYRLSFWIALLGTAVMLGWLILLGTQWWIAVLAVAFILGAHLVVVRVVAETGLPIYRASIAPAQVYTTLPATWVTGRDVFFASTMTVLGPLTTRDSVMGAAATGYAVAHAGGVPESEKRRLGLALALTLTIGLAVSAVATLYCQTTWPTPLQKGTPPERNFFGAVEIPRREVVSPVREFNGTTFAPKGYNAPAYMGVGATAVGALQFATLRWAWWPLMPVGFVVSYGAFIGNAWFSIFVGWLAKAVIVRLGGLDLFNRAKPFFVGMIFGESLMAGLWLIFNAGMVMSGYESMGVKFLL